MGLRRANRMKVISAHINWNRNSNGDDDKDVYRGIDGHDEQPWMESLGEVVVCVWEGGVSGTAQGRAVEASSS